LRKYLGVEGGSSLADRLYNPDVAVNIAVERVAGAGLLEPRGAAVEGQVLFVVLFELGLFLDGVVVLFVVAGARELLGDEEVSFVLAVEEVAALLLKQQFVVIPAYDVGVDVEGTARFGNLFTRAALVLSRRRPAVGRQDFADQRVLDLHLLTER
jgi:hypothetical protein